MIKLFAIVVHGKERVWDFLFEGDDKYLQEWLDDGLDIAEVVEVIPAEDHVVNHVKNWWKSNKSD